MAFSDNYLAMDQQQQPWKFLSTTFSEPWLSETFSREAETLTKALQKSISNQSDDFSSDVFNPFLHQTSEATTTTTFQVKTQTPTVSGGSESETAVSKQRKTTTIGGNGGKVMKRRSRASKRMTTTYIETDPENFRQMVQQVTGMMFGGDRQLPILPTFKPEPQRTYNNYSMQTNFLPTLDTSAFLLDQVNHQPPMSLDQSFISQPSAADSVAPSAQSQPEWAVADGGSAGSFDFDFFCNFPILESNVI